MANDRETPDWTPYPELNSVLRELVSGVTGLLGENCLSVCLQGSFAVGGFDGHSDVDFIVLLKWELAEAEVLSLQSFHARLFRLAPAWTRDMERTLDFVRHCLALSQR